MYFASVATTELLHLAIKGACLSLVESQSILNKLDTESGDGDCGTTMKTGAEGTRNTYILYVVLVVKVICIFDHTFWGQQEIFIGNGNLFLSIHSHNS